MKRDEGQSRGGFRDWLRTLADARALVPAEEVLRRFGDASGSDTSTASTIDPTIAEVAAELGRSPSTVRGWRLNEEFPNAYRLGREWRIPRSDIRAFLDRQKADPPQQPAQGGKSTEVEDLGSWRQVYRRAS